MVLLVKEGWHHDNPWKKDNENILTETDAGKANDPENGSFL